LISLEAILRDRRNSQDLLLRVHKLFDELTNNNINLPDNPNKDKIKDQLLASIATETKGKSKSSRWTKSIVKMAAMGLIALLSVLYFYTSLRKSNTEIQWTTIRTNYGERKKVRLSDSTTVILNGNSTLTYPLEYASNIRVVRLKGEAFFEVSNNPAKPFFVIARNFTTQVVGTAFNIDSDIERLVEVNSGKVNVYRIDENDLIHVLANPTNEPQ